MEDTTLVNKFSQLLESLEPEEIEALDQHFDAISGAIYRFMVNAYKSERDQFIDAATRQLSAHVDDLEFAEDHAQVLWDSVRFTLRPESPEDAVEAEISYWGE